MKKTSFFSSLQRGQRGSVMGTLMVGIGLAGALSVATYQILSGPLAGISKVNQVNMTQTQLMTVARIAVMDAATMTAAGDCDADGFVEPRAARTGTGPTNGGLLPLGMGAPLTDPWGREFGYCAWDVGPLTAQAGCGGAAGRLDGADNPLAGDAKTTTVLAVVSAGADGTFSTTCNAWNTTTDVIATLGDDLVYRLSYQEAAGATASTWALKSGDATTAAIAKDLQVGTGGNEISFDAAGGFISALAVNNNGKVTATGGMELGDQVSAPTCNASTNVGVLRYNTVDKNIEICKGVDGWGEVTAAGGGGATGMIGTNIAGACDGTKIGYIKYVTGTATPWYYCNGTAWTVLQRENQTKGCTIGAAVGTGYCAGTINGEDIIVARRGCNPGAAVAGDCAGADETMRWAAGTSAHGTQSSGLYDGPLASATALANGVHSNSVFGYCDSLTLDGKKWAVPSLAELHLIYLNDMRGLLTAANFNGRYWTAAGFLSNQALKIRFDEDARMDFDSQTDTNEIRCIYKRPSATAAICSGPSACKNIGDECGSGGPIFVGCHPSTQRQLFVTRCSPGETAAANKACTGTPTTYNWSNNSDITNLRATGVSGTFNGAGNTGQLTNGVVNGGGDAKSEAGVQDHNAAKYCQDLVQDGYSDWYLPAVGEMMTAHLTLSKLGFGANMGSTGFWTSTETTANPAQLSMVVFNGVYSTSTKNSAWPLRCMRSDTGSTLAFCGEDDISRCILGSPRNNSDAQFTAPNIRQGVNILGVTGTLPNCANDSSIDCILNATRLTSDADYLPDNIAAGKSILGVAGTMQVNDPFTWSLSGNDDHVCMTRARGTATSQASCWGEGSNGRLGNGLTSDQILPIQVHNLTTTPGWNSWITISAGPIHTCGIKYAVVGGVQTGTPIAMCWGNNAGGRLGDNSTTQRTRPVIVCGNAACSYPASVGALLTAISNGSIYGDWVKIDAGGAKSCGIRSDKSLWCWGDGSGGHIGDGTGSGSKTRPVLVHTDTGPGGWYDWTQVTVGDTHICGLRENGTAWCWGWGDIGQMGNGTDLNNTRPVQVRDSAGTGFWSDWVQIDADGSVTCARRSNGSLYCWGRNDEGQMGVGSALPQINLPTQVQTDTGPGAWTDWTKVACGGPSCCGIRNGGEAWCWGTWAYGALGGDQTTNQTRPVRVRDAISCTAPAGTTFFNDWIDITVFAYGACGIRANGTIWCWGRHDSGQLGWGGAAGAGSGLCITQVVGM